MATFQYRTTERLRLTEFSIHDAARWKAISMSDMAALYYLNVYAVSENEVYEKLQRYSRNKDNGYYIAIRDRNRENVLIGGIIAVEGAKPGNFLEVECILNDNYQREGYMKEALEEFFKMVDDTNLEKLCFTIDKKQVAYVETLRQLGLQLISQSATIYNQLLYYEYPLSRIE